MFSAQYPDRSRAGLPVHPSASRWSVQEEHGQHATGFCCLEIGADIFRMEDLHFLLDSLGAFLYFDFFRGLSQSYIPKRCDNCGMFFLLEAGKHSSYCERPLEDDPEKTCRDVGARKKYGDKCKTDPVWLAYNRAYKTHYARYMKKKMTIAEFEQWSRQAIEWRNQAETGELEQAEYERLLKK